MSGSQERSKSNTVNVSSKSSGKVSDHHATGNRLPVLSSEHLGRILSHNAHVKPVFTKKTDARSEFSGKVSDHHATGNRLPVWSSEHPG